MLDAVLQPGRLRSLGKSVLLIGVVGGLVVVVLLVGGVRLFALLTLSGWLVAAAYRWPLMLAGIGLLASGDFLKFMPEGVAPSISLGQSLSLNFLDLVVIVCLPFAAARLIARRERPVFLWPILILMSAGLMSAVGGLLQTQGDLNAAGNLLRCFFYYGMYFVLVAAIDSQRKLKWSVSFLLGVGVVASAIQIAEAVLGHRFGGGLNSLDIFSYGSEGRVAAGDVASVLYLWNRAAGLTLLVLMLSLGVALESRFVRTRYLLLAALTLASFALAFVRQYFVYVAVGVVGVLVSQRTARSRGVVVLASVLGTTAVAFVVAAPLLTASFGPSFMSAWVARAGSLLSFGNVATYVGRLTYMRAAWERFLESPVFGHGGVAVVSTGGAVASDVGVFNTLIDTGLAGVIAVLIAWIAFLVVALRLRRDMRPGTARGYVAGLIGFWLAVLTGYMYGVDYFGASEGIWVVVVALALLDRIRRLIPLSEPTGAELAIQDAGARGRPRLVRKVGS